MAGERGSLHPLFSYFGPADPPWPRILVIGQEPDADMRVGTHAGPYDLPGGGGVPFWTWSHKAVERASGFPAHLFNWAAAVGSSPIAYADASPAGYAVGTGALPDRPAVTAGELAQHARNLLALPEAAACRVVIISGRKWQWAAFYDIAEPGFRAAGAVVVAVPFFGYTRASNRESLTGPLLAPEVQPVIRHVVAAWAQAHRERLPPAVGRWLDERTVS